VGPRAGLDTVKMGKISFPYRESNPGSPARSPSLYRLSCWLSEAIKTLKSEYKSERGSVRAQNSVHKTVTGFKMFISRFGISIFELNLKVNFLSMCPSPC
jgi:hypothetical protein